MLNFKIKNKSGLHRQVSPSEERLDNFASAAAFGSKDGNYICALGEIGQVNLAESSPAAYITEDPSLQVIYADTAYLFF